MRMRKFLAVVAALLALGLTGTALAATGNTTVSATVPSALSITVPATHVLTVTMGSQATTNLSVDVKSNAGWSMTAFKGSDLTTGALSIPSPRLVYTSSSTNGSGVAVNTQFETSTSPTNVVTGGTKTGEAGATVTVNYKLTVNYDDDPGTYSAIHTYTATAI